MVPRPVAFQPGDILACSGRDWISQGIRWATWSPLAPRGLRLGPSHVAIVTESDRGLLLVESTTLCQHPCEYQGKCVSGVQAHVPEQRVRDYLQSGGQVALYRLTAINQFDQPERQLLRHILFRHFLMEPVGYDLEGAILSGTRAIRWLGLLPGADLHSLFCSELVAAILMRLNRLNHANPTGFSPARLLRMLVTSGKYHRVNEWADLSAFEAITHAS